MNRLVPVMILQWVALTPRLLNPGSPMEHEGFRHLYLDERQLRLFARDPVNELSDSFLDEALGKGDRCSAILQGDRLVNYVWCSTAPTRLSEHVLIEFGSDWLYRYKAFTIPACRGRRLYAMNTSITLGETAALGLKGLLGFAHINNYSSLKAMHRCGYTDVGKSVVLKVPGTCWINVDPRCRAYGLAFTLLQTARP